LLKFFNKYGPIVYQLGHDLLKVERRVRFPLGLQIKKIPIRYLFYLFGLPNGNRRERVKTGVFTLLRKVHENQTACRHSFSGGARFSWESALRTSDALVGATNKIRYIQRIL